MVRFAYHTAHTCFALLLAVVLTSAASQTACAQAAPPQQPQVVLLDFWLAGCGPCRAMDPIVAQLQREGFPVQRVDGNQQPALAQRFRVDRYPTFILVANGREVKRHTGPMSYGNLRSMIALGGPAAMPRRAQAGAPQYAGGPSPRRGSQQGRQRSAPATFATTADHRPAPTDQFANTPAAFQVGGDLGPAAPGISRSIPEVSIPGEPSRPASQQQAFADPRFNRPPPQPGMPAANAIGQAAPNSNLSPALLRSSVRFTVIDPKGKSFGTGTLIDARSGEALVLTCAHLFRDEQGQAITAPNAISVELFEPSGNGVRVVDRVPGQLISYDFERDLALVSIRPRVTPQVARVADTPQAPVVQQPVWSVGCDQGADPTVRTSQVTAINRYQGTPNVTATGAPVVGRSGGGLFNAQGQLVAVCFAADEQGNEGLYAGLAAVQQQLNELGLQDVYASNAAPQQNSPAAQALGQPVAQPLAASNGFNSSSNTPSNISPSSIDTSGLVAIDPTPPATQQPFARGQAPAAALPSNLSAAERAAIQELSNHAAESEVVCVIRPKTPGGRSEVITLNSASPAFMESLRAMQR